MQSGQQSEQRGSADVIPLRERRADPEVVGQLRSILVDAEQGLVTGMIAAAHYSDGEILYAGAGSMCASPAVGVLAANVLAKKLLA